MGSQSPRVRPPSRRICYSKRGKSFAIYGLTLRSLSWSQAYEEFLFYRPPFFFRLELYYKTRICGQSRKGNSYSRQWIRVLTCLVKLAFWAGIKTETKQDLFTRFFSRFMVYLVSDFRHSFEMSPSLHSILLYQVWSRSLQSREHQTASKPCLPAVWIRWKTQVSRMAVLDRGGTGVLVCSHKTLQVPPCWRTGSETCSSPCDVTSWGGLGHSDWEMNRWFNCFLKADSCSSMIRCGIYF